MAHESFEDPQVAAVLNRDYVCIKVDREERPDIDTVYMNVCQILTGSGGWPLTILMTPSQKPFWAGTYLPKTGAYGRLGLLELLAAATHQWNSARETLLSSGDQITSFLKTHKRAGAAPAEPQRSLLQRAAAELKRTYDPQWGGFGPAPKFPTAYNLLFLLQYSLWENSPSARDMAAHTLTQMFCGGIFDHLGGGFSRYSTDEKWLVPHFEKMLYDNALLALAYLEAYHITRRPFYRMVAARTLDYTLRELTDPQGGFYCGQDADSEGVEGKYYAFTVDEVHRILGAEDGAALCDWFGMTAQGNFEGKNILNLLENPRYEETSPHIGALIDKLYAYRLTRTPLHKDDKVLTAWNALMIAALAKAGRLLCEPAYLQAAQKAQHFLNHNLMDARGRLLLRWREGEAAHAGQLDDYAFYAFALLELYRCTHEVEDLRQAVEIAAQMVEQFWDDDAGGFFFYAKDSEPLISRPKETYDGAIPAGNSAAAVVLGQLSKLTGEVKWQRIHERQLSFIAAAVQNYPAGHGMALTALAQVLYPSQELVCATAEQSLPAGLLSFLAENALPGLTLLVKTAKNKDALAKVAPFTADYPVPESGTAYYLCQNGVCAAPVYAPEALIALLQPQAP